MAPSFCSAIGAVHGYLDLGRYQHDLFLQWETS